jgi:hypothetical protein
MGNRTSHGRHRTRGAKRRSAAAAIEPAGEVGRVLGIAIVAGVAIAIGSVVLERPATSLWRLATETAEKTEAREHTVYYARCDDARAAGAAPIYAGEPGYRAGLDGDGDGIACEPHRR